MCCANKMVMADTNPQTPQWKLLSIRLKDYEEFVCGWGSALINIMITFPINKVMFRQMLHGVDSQSAIRQLKMEGAHFLYRGCLPPMIQKTTSVSLMFGTFKLYTEKISGQFPSIGYFSVLCAAATLAGGTEALLTPLERVQTLLQDRHYNAKFRNTFHAFIELRHYGLREYYRGLTPILIRNAVGNFLFFSFKDRFRDGVFPVSDSLVTKVINDFIIGAFVGAMSSTIFYPVNVVKTQMQVCCGTKFQSLFEAFRSTYNERGRSIRKMYLGVHVNYTRAFISWGIINASHQLLKSCFFNDDDNNSKS